MLSYLMEDSGYLEAVFGFQTSVNLFVCTVDSMTSYNSVKQQKMSSSLKLKDSKFKYTHCYT